MAYKRLTTPEIMAAVDLGSNSFHMVIARFTNGELVVVDRIKEMVRLAEGLGPDNVLTLDSQERALETLARFGDRVKGMPKGSVLAVGTNTLRKAANTRGFLRKAEEALGHDISVVSGAEEARLIYLGVAQTIGASEQPRLVMDIGGGSTEFIIGRAYEPVIRESKYMGCVSFSKKYFPDGALTKRAFDRAVIAAQQEIRGTDSRFKKVGWEQAVGSSGTIRAVYDILVANGTERAITYRGLKALRTLMIEAGCVEKLDSIKGLPVGRAPVLAGGVAILLAAFKSLGIESMSVSDGALREGLLYDLLGRYSDADIRDETIEILATKNQVDTDHAKRVTQTAMQLYEAVADTWELRNNECDRFLAWAAEIHEIGMSISYSRYHKHGSYLVQNSELPGFSREDQKLLWAIIRSHRRSFKAHRFVDLHLPFDRLGPRLTVLLRLAVVLARSRTDDLPLPKIKIKEPHQVRLKFEDDLLDSSPLLLADLQEEASFLAPAFELKFK